ncbi:MAG: hypothetical protein ACTSRI_18380 [Promethearchaeota archaeon]
MIYQLIMRDVEWYQFLINAIIVILGRSLDILSTRYVTKELKLETNKLAQRLGWRGMVLIQIPIVILGALDFYLAFFIFFWSLFLFANNIEGSWYIKEVGEENYLKELKTRVEKSKRWKIIFGELSNVLTFTLAGVFILIFLFVFNDLIAVFFIAFALICVGLLGTFRSLAFLFSIRKKQLEKQTEGSSI